MSLSTSEWRFDSSDDLSCFLMLGSMFEFGERLNIRAFEKFLAKVAPKTRLASGNISGVIFACDLMRKAFVNSGT